MKLATFASKLCAALAEELGEADVDQVCVRQRLDGVIEIDAVLSGAERFRVAQRRTTREQVDGVHGVAETIAIDLAKFLREVEAAP